MSGCLWRRRSCGVIRGGSHDEAGASEDKCVPKLELGNERERFTSSRAATGGTYRTHPATRKALLTAAIPESFCIRGRRRNPGSGKTRSLPEAHRVFFR